MTGRSLKQGLAGLQAGLTVALSGVVIVIAIVLFRSLVDAPSPAATSLAPAAVPTTGPPRAVPSAPAAPAAPTSTTREFDCTAEAPRGDDRTRIVRVFYACGDRPAPDGTTWVYREIDDAGGVLTQTMQALVAGPTPEERAAGFRSVFSAATLGAVLSVTRDGGAVVVDLRDLGPLPALKNGAEGAFLLADLNNTLFQHTDVSSLEYRIEGSCERFWSYLGDAECLVISRAIWEANPAAAS